MESMKLERLDEEGLWISAGGDPVTRLFLCREKRDDGMPQIKTVTVNTEEKTGYAKTICGAGFDFTL